MIGSHLLGRRIVAIAACLMMAATLLPACSAGAPQTSSQATSQAGAAATSAGIESASQADSPSVAPVVSGTYYTRQSLTDYQIGVPVFSALLPQGWTARLDSDWSVVSVGAPGFEEVTITSPDGSAVITIDSCQAFTQAPSGFVGQDEATYSTYMNYLDAVGFVDAYMAQAYGGQAQLVQELPADADTMSQLGQYTDLMVAVSNQAGYEMTAGGAIGNVTSTAEAYESTLCKRQYRIGSQYMEATCVDSAVLQTIASPYLTEQYLHWRIPYSITYVASDQQAFDEYYGDYCMIVANSYFTAAYYAAEDYVASTITSAAMDAKAAATSATGSFSTSGYESEYGESANEKIINMWDDYINEADSYNTLDGGTVKVSMYDDVVAQNGDEIFVGSATSDIPAGFTELSKSY